MERSIFLCFVTPQPFVYKFYHRFQVLRVVALWLVYFHLLVRGPFGPFYRTSSGFRLCWELDEPEEPKKRNEPQLLLSVVYCSVDFGGWMSVQLCICKSARFLQI